MRRVFGGAGMYVICEEEGASYVIGGGGTIFRRDESTWEGRGILSNGDVEVSYTVGVLEPFGVQGDEGTRRGVESSCFTT